MKHTKLISIILLVVAFVMIMALSACGGGNSIPENMEDGTYTGRSSDYPEDEDGNGAGYGQVEVTVKDNKIVDCTFNMYELDGTLKDETYGADMSKENRLKAQKAVQSTSKYAAALVSAGSLDGVDAISGATISYNEFLEAVADALSKAAAE